MKKYFNYSVQKSIRVKSLITVESLDVSPSFCYPQEEHDFYEFAYIDSGAIRCIYEDEPVELSQGDFFMISPHKRHFYEAAPEKSASFLVVCFSASGELLSLLERRIALEPAEKRAVFDVLHEAENAFNFPFRKRIKPRDDPLFGAQQMVENHIERLLILLIRRELKDQDRVKLVMNSVELENRLVKDVIGLLKDNLCGKITLDEISRQTYYSRTFLSTVFKKNTGHPIMQYYNMLKIKEAKKLLRENKSSGAIANRLHFESASYFTKVFKKYTGLTPGDYRKTIL